MKWLTYLALISGSVSAIQLREEPKASKDLTAEEKKTQEFLPCPTAP